MGKSIHTGGSFQKQGGLVERTNSIILPSSLLPLCPSLHPPDSRRTDICDTNICIQIELNSVLPYIQDEVLCFCHPKLELRNLCDAFLCGSNIKQGWVDGYTNKEYVWIMFRGRWNGAVFRNDELGNIRKCMIFLTLRYKICTFLVRLTKKKTNGYPRYIHSHDEKCSNVGRFHTLYRPRRSLGWVEV